MKFQSSAFPAMQAELLPRRAYSARDPVLTHTLGVALERQRGVHAIGSDRRTDFDTWPGTLAYTPPGVEVFSESPGGGEYLVVRWTPAADVVLGVAPDRRHQWSGHGQALRAAIALRRLLLTEAPDALAIEQAMLALVGLDARAPVAPAQSTRVVYQRVLERIASGFDQPLAIAQLAAEEGRTPLAFLREFTRAVGMTPHAFIVETRVQAARAMMADAGLPLSHIAAACGFTHQSHMGVAFRKVLGQTPGAYRARRCL
ncbi:AraC-like DNA-binding protein [Duganella sp. 1224]|uniref:helix-turn-helix domain-containing protein n=1 Tax=Duganella sp. 1224 TaxID=2587052 RepID=UPI001857B343|nr:AraC family transcriptional regulator [Duganella sp. 1224]NYE59422.1 AraC-like DNA-binding protein [Duganella sp. 1224]